VYLAGIAVPGELRTVIPGRVQVLKSQDLSKWTEMEVDYRAVARQVTFSAPNDNNLWIATDNGMILKLK
jgi:beta-xylosidase